MPTRDPYRKNRGAVNTNYHTGVFREPLSGATQSSEKIRRTADAGESDPYKTSVGRPQ